MRTQILLSFSILFLCFSLFPRVESAVMGVDLGSEFYKISMIAPGKSFVILENTMSHRKTHTAISFTNEERIYESASVLKKVKYPESTFHFVKKFISAMANDQKVVEVSKAFYEDYLLETDANRETLNFKIPHFHLQNEFTHNENGDFILSVEEVLAMILIHAKQLAEEQIQSEIRDCVFTIPSNWDLNKKQALLVSAQLANLTVLSFIKENTAAALNYGFERQDLESNHLALIYNLGSSSLKASLVEFSAVNVSNKTIENIRVLADETNEEVSARHFDLILARHLGEVFDNLPQRKGKKSIFDYRPNFRRLLSEAAKFKEVLSANKEAYFYVEGLLDDIDFRVLVERAVFESKSSDLLPHLTAIIDTVLSKAKKTKEEIDSIEIIGGGVRIPMVQNKLAEFFNGKEIGAHLNGDESMAFGAVFQAANYSGIYRVRKIWLYDGYEHGVRLTVKELANGEVIRKDDLFEAGEYFGLKKQWVFTEPKNLQLVFERKKEDGYEAIRTYDFTNIESFHQGLEGLNITDFHISFNFTLCSIRGVDVIGSAVYHTSKMKEVEEIIFEEEEANSTETQNSANNESEAPPPPPGEEKMNTEENASNSSNNTNAEKPKNLKPKKIKQLKEIIKRYEKKLNYTLWTMEPRSLNEEEMILSRRKIEFLNEDEELRKKTAQAKNELEEFIYKINEYNSDEFYLLVSNESQREPINKLAEENRDWLETDEGFAANYSEYTRRVKEIKNLTMYITWRIEEYKMRPQAINDTRNYLKEWEKTVAAMNNSHPWIPFKERFTTLQMVKQAQNWLEKTIAAQENLTLFDNPVLKVYELNDMLELLGRNVTNLKNSRPPKNYYEDLIKKMNFNFTKNDTNKNEKNAEDGEDNSRPKFDSEEEVSMDDEPNEPPHDGKRGSTTEKNSEESKQEESHREDHETENIDKEQTKEDL